MANRLKTHAPLLFVWARGYVLYTYRESTCTAVEKLTVSSHPDKYHPNNSFPPPPLRPPHGVLVTPSPFSNQLLEIMSFSIRGPTLLACQQSFRPLFYRGGQSSSMNSRYVGLSASITRSFFNGTPMMDGWSGVRATPHTRLEARDRPPRSKVSHWSQKGQDYPSPLPTYEVKAFRA